MENQNFEASLDYTERHTLKKKKIANSNKNILNYGFLPQAPWRVLHKPLKIVLKYAL